ncbi:cupin-like domain-containing protein [Streptomyces sp. Go40/10]|uniref:cupin-like domain-containing protein n=1 Tax=Streptomyces sp. Go40/10 TaxID=2825844 RepID=UPI001E330B45|nr:cupin-like domain-containing protein [Streptomyces sp. Go40/10]UFQ99802.1 cupin-like domain-containing protein [Streptomyces sp. Go40/10]
MSSSTGAWPPPREFWADTLPAKTDGMRSPYLFKGIVPAPAANATVVLDSFAAIRRAHAAGLEITANARVYVGEEHRPDLVDKVLAAEGWAEGDFVAWMQQQVGAERFSLILNTLESVSEPLAAGLGEFVGALIDGWGVPAGGAELVAFVGNYSGTAFGVHEGYENAFLTHYGSGTKDFYCWPAEEYKKLTGGSDPQYGDYTWLLEHGEHFALEPGDALFLPERVFHVGRQSEFSVSVAIPLYTFPDAAIARGWIAPDMVESLLASAPDTAAGQPSPMQPLSAGPGELARRLGEVTAAAFTAAAQQASAAAEQHAHQRWHTVLSNGGWQQTELDLARNEAAAAFAATELAPGTSVAVRAPYRLIVTGEQAFLRGCEAPADPAVLTPDLVERLNNGPTSLPDDPQALSAIRTLGATGGLTLTTTSEETE